MVVEDVGEEEEEGVTTMEAEIVETLMGAVVEAGTLVEEVGMEMVGGMAVMIRMPGQEKFHKKRRTQGGQEGEKEGKDGKRMAKQSVKISK